MKHTRIEGDEQYRWPRVLCGVRGRANRDAGTWSRSLPTCPQCAVLRDLWLERGPGKPPTIRRWRAFLDAHPEALNIIRAAGNSRT